MIRRVIAPALLLVALVMVAGCDVVGGGGGSDSGELLPLIPPLKGSVTVADALQVRELATLGGFPGAVVALTFNPEGSILAAGDAHGVVRLWDLGVGASLDSFRGAEGPVLALAWNLDGSTLTAAYPDQTLHIWDPAIAEEVAVLEGSLPDPDSVVFTPDRTVAAVANGASPLYLKDSAGRQLIVLGEAAALSVAFNPMGSVLASGEADGTIRLWGVPYGAEPNQITMSEAEVNALVAAALADYPAVSEAAVTLNEGADPTVSFSAEVAGQTLSGTAKAVIMPIEEGRLALVLEDVRLAGLPAPGALVDEINAALAETAVPALNAEVAARAPESVDADGELRVESITYVERLLVVTVTRAE